MYPEMIKPYQNTYELSFVKFINQKWMAHANSKGLPSKLIPSICMLAKILLSDSLSGYYRSFH